jgi:hypothetical protein
LKHKREREREREREIKLLPKTHSPEVDYSLFNDGVVGGDV